MTEERMIPLSVPNLKGNELAYVKQAVESEWVSTAGPYVSQFEKDIAEYVHVPSAVACQSGTAGLHIALQICGVSCNDLVIVPTLTFIAAVNPVRYLGADPVFMDCDDSLCMDPEKLAEFCREECIYKNNTLYHKETGRRIAAVVVVHVFGNMADMEVILRIAEQYNLKVVEDATEAIGTKYETGLYAGRFAGTMGDIGVYSFNGNKIITTGGGGMIVSRNMDYLREAKHLTTQAKADEANFIHDEVGYNYRLTNLQAALGIAQLEQLETFISTKKRNYDLYRKLLPENAGLAILKYREGIRSNCWFYSLMCEDFSVWKPAEIIQKLKDQHIQTRPIWGLIHEQAPYRGSICYKIEKADYYWKRVVNLPCSTNLTGEDVERVIKAIFD
jgi:aminotransferase in exopolysaccharide biosynthesis